MAAAVRMGRRPHVQAFAGMWGAMTVTMMLPVLAPVLWRYRQSAGPLAAARSIWLVAGVGAGYFAVWMAVGALVFPAGAALTSAAARLPALTRAMPFVAGAVVWAQAPCNSPDGRRAG